MLKQKPKPTIFFEEVDAKQDRITWKQKEVHCLKVQPLNNSTSVKLSGIKRDQLYKRDENRGKKSQI